MDELNPNHPVTQAVSDHWHKLAALLMHKMGSAHVVITMSDLESLQPGTCITVQELHDGIHLRLVDITTAEQMARQQGGLPH